MEKCALITGGTKGIGKAVAFCLGKAGYDLVLTYASDSEKAEQTRDGLQQQFGIKVSVLQADITKKESIDKIDAYLREKNIHFPVFLLQRVVQLINKGGSVVFTGSLMGIQPHSVSLAYGVTKSAVHALVKNMVKFLTPYELRVNAVAPGFVDTEWQKTKPAEIRKNIENKVSLGRFCDPEELAEVYKMLIENSYFNGEVVVVDGGYSYK